ncbi:MAG: hypothetical protein ACREEM_21865 [Blastocatellia bacterium]
MIDLIFDELEPATSQRLLAEIKLCPLCQAQYQTMSQTLQVFDQVTERVTPQEEYWPNYEARLRARLAEETPAGPWQRLKSRLAGFTLLPTPASVAAAVALLALVLGGWWWIGQPQKINDNRMIAGPGSNQVQPSPAPTQPAISQNDVARDSGVEQKPKSVGSSRPRRQMKLAPREAPLGREDVIAQFQPPVTTAPFFTPDTTRHFEKAQLLLRSFRNAGRNAGVDLDYEKRQSRSLLYQNILLRRDAEAKGNLPAEEVLGALEPLLLDIANLPANPSRGDMQNIKERIARQEMIAVLHTHAAQPASLGLGQD